MQRIVRMMISNDDDDEINTNADAQRERQVQSVRHV